MRIVTIAGAAVRFLAVVHLSVLTSLLLWSHAPALVGWQPRVVLSGSMAPGIRAGDVSVIAPVSVGPSTLPPGSVVLVRDATKSSGYYLHRLVRYEENGNLITRGDANRNEDSDPVDPQAIKGQLRLVVPLVGRPVLWMAGHDYLALLALAAATWGSLAVVLARRRGVPAPSAG